MEKLFRRLLGCFFKGRKPLTSAAFSRLRSIYRERNCSYCVYLRTAVNWWCFNEKACRERGDKCPRV